MRFAPLALAAFVLTTAPVHAGATPASGAKGPACVAGLAKASSGEGYRVVRKCGNSASSKKPTSIQVAREPVNDGSNFKSGSSIILSLFSVAAITGGIILATDGRDRVLPDDTGGGGVDPASP